MVRLEFKLEIGRSHPRSSSRSRSLSPDSDRIPLVDRSAQQHHPREDPTSISLPPSPTSEKLADALSSPPPKGYHRVTTSETEIPGNDTQPLVKGPPGGGGGGPGKPPGEGGKPAEPYTEFSPWRRKFILAVITTAGFFGPLAGGIYLPALPVLTKEFNATPTAINVSVTVFMATFAVGVSNNSCPSASNGKSLMMLLAPFLVDFCRLERPSPIISNLALHLYRCQHSACRSTCQLWSAGLPAHRAGVWKCGSREYGRWNRC